MKRNISIALLSLVLLVLAVIPGCSGKNNASSKQIDKTGKISVYTSFYTMYDFAGKIGGDRISLSNIVPSGIEPHDWEPSPSVIANLEKADVFIYNGAGMEGWVEKVLASVGNRKLITVEAVKDLKLLDSTEKSSDLKYDPHVWLNPALAKKEMESIKNALEAADPANKTYYENNYSLYAAELDRLDQEYRNAVSGFSRKEIVVAHQAFGYLCDAYGLKQIAIEGLAAESEPTPAKMAEITKYVKDNNIKIIFYENLISPKVAQAIARETGAGTGVLNPIEGLDDDDIKAGKDYFSIMRDNLKALTSALK